MRILGKALFICALFALPAPAARADAGSGGWQPPASLPGATLVPLDEADGRTVLVLRRAPGRTDEAPTPAPADRTSDAIQNVTVIIDGVLMDLPYWVVATQIRNGTFIVIGPWTIRFG